MTTSTQTAKNQTTKKIIKTTAEGTTKVLFGSIGLPINQATGAYVPHSDAYVDTHGHLETIAYAVENNLPVLLIGETGTGKTSAIRYLAKETNNNFRRINLNGSTTVDELVGKILINKEGTYWTDGVLIDAMRHGHWLLLDEINAALPEVLFVLHSLLDDDGYVVLSEKEDHEIVRPHKDFRIFATCNPFEKYSGTKDMNKAFLSRFPVVIDIPFPTKEQELEILKIKSPAVSDMLLESMIQVANAVRESVNKDEMDFVFSTRDLIYWANMYAHMKHPVLSATTTFLAKANKEDRASMLGLISAYVPNDDATILSTKDIQAGEMLQVIRDIKVLNQKNVIVKGSHVLVDSILDETHSPVPGEKLFSVHVKMVPPTSNATFTAGDMVAVTGVEISTKVIKL